MFNNVNIFEGSWYRSTLMGQISGQHGDSSPRKFSLRGKVYVLFTFFVNIPPYGCLCLLYFFFFFTIFSLTVCYLLLLPSSLPPSPICSPRLNNSMLFKTSKTTTTLLVLFSLVFSYLFPFTKTKTHSFFFFS